MSNYRFIGVGAAGNKGAIKLIETGVVRKEEVLLLNTTMRDIDMEYRSNGRQIGSNMSGSGKERRLAEQLTKAEIEAGRMGYLNEFVSAEDIYACVIIAAAGGGSGSGAAIAIANHIMNLGVHVHMCSYLGFGIDSRELQNTIGFAKGLEDDFGVEFICNSKFLEEAGNNIQKAEELANIELATRMQIYTGAMLRDSSQNIDDTELFKINTTPGFTAIEYSKLPKIKNQAQFDKIINDMADHTKSPDFDAKSVRIGIMINIAPDSFTNIDSRFESIKARFAPNPDELFIHIQYEPDMDEFVAVVACGNEIPVDDIKAMGEDLSKRQAVKRETTDRSRFFKEMSALSSEDGLDDMDLNSTRRRTIKTKKESNDNTAF